MSSNGGRTASVLVLLAAMCLPPQLAHAHPMGNFSVNHYTEITLREDHIEILYMVDMAEIPAYQEIQQAGIVAREGDPSLIAYLPAKGRLLQEHLVLEVEGKKLPLHLVSQQIIFPPGSGGLPTIKMGFVYGTGRCAVEPGATVRLRFVDLNFPGHAGWKEIIVNAPADALLSSSVPTRDRSNRLSNYPTDLLNSPPQDLEANITFKPFVRSETPMQEAASSKTAGARKETSALARTQKMPLPTRDRKAPAGATRARASLATKEIEATARPAQPVQLQANRQGTPRSVFTELISAKRLSIWFLVVAAAVSAGLGALHALEPGHGKTIVAAYLVGSRGTARHALLLGVTVTVSHTAGVYLLGAITLYAQKYILPERIYPFLGVLSGVLIAGMGCYLLLQRYLGAEFAHTHSYQPSPADKPARDGSPRKAFTSQLLLLGITGGMIPCPGALVVLLSAVALRRTGLGLFLIVAFSVGLAAVLIAMGLTAVYAGRILSRLRLEGPLVQRWLPMASAAIIAILGFGITVRGLMAAGIIHLRLWA